MAMSQGGGGKKALTQVSDLGPFGPLVLFDLIGFVVHSLVVIKPLTKKV